MMLVSVAKKGLSGKSLCDSLFSFLHTAHGVFRMASVCFCNLDLTFCVRKTTKSDVFGAK